MTKIFYLEYSSLRVAPTISDHLYESCLPISPEKCRREFPPLSYSIGLSREIWRYEREDITTRISSRRDDQICTKERSRLTRHQRINIGRHLTKRDKSRTREEYDEKEDHERSPVREDDTRKKYEHRKNWVISRYSESMVFSKSHYSFWKTKIIS